MENNESITIRLSQEELFLILMRFRMPLIVGMNRQLTELSQEQLELLMGAAERSLLAREFLKVSPEGTPKLEPVVLAVVGACAQPEKSVVMIHAKTDQKDMSMTVNLARKMVVAHVPIPPGIHQFTALQNVQSAAQLVVSRLGAGNPLNVGIPDGEIRESIFVQARELITGKRLAEAVAALATDLPPVTAQELAQAMSSPAAESTFAAITNPTSNDAQAKAGFSLLEGSQATFLFTPHGEGSERMIRVQPATRDLIREAVEQLF